LGKQRKHDYEFNDDPLTQFMTHDMMKMTMNDKYHKNMEGEEKSIEPSKPGVFIMRAIPDR
jgi:hypothetical protein